MLRFIIKRNFQASYGPEMEGYETVDIDVPELERILLGGGMASGGPGHDIRNLEGVEILAQKEPTND